MESRPQPQITMLQCHGDQNDPHGLAGHVGARFECPCAFVSHAHCVCDCCEKEPIKKHYNNIAFLHNMVDPQTRLGNVKPSRGRETGTRGLWVKAQVHETQPHEHRGAGVRARSQTLERGRALSKASGGTRVRGGVCIARGGWGGGASQGGDEGNLCTHAWCHLKCKTQRASNGELHGLGLRSVRRGGRPWGERSRGVGGGSGFGHSGALRKQRRPQGHQPPPWGSRPRGH